MTITPVRQGHFLLDLPDWFEDFMPTPWLRQLPQQPGRWTRAVGSFGHCEGPLQRWRL
jgi:hypothetical protein